MKCPTETQESAALLLAYCAGRLDVKGTAAIERHLGICPPCREFARGQQALWEALDTWEADPVSVEFDRRLYRRIEREVRGWDRLIRPLRALPIRHSLPVASAACVVVIVGALLQQPAAMQPASWIESAQLEPVQPEQVEHALDDMQMLSDFSRQVRATGNE